MRSLHGQLTARLLAVALALSAAAGTGAYLYSRAAHTRAFDAAAEGRARVLAAMVMIEPTGEIEVEIEPEALPELYEDHPREYFELRRGDGTVVAAAPALAGRALAAGWSRWGPSHAADVPLPDGRRGRVMALKFYPRVEAPDEEDVLPPDHVQPTPDRYGQFTLLLARDRADLDHTLAVMLTSLLTWGGVLVAGTALAVALTVRAGLRPLRALADQAARMDARSLDERFATDGVAHELRPIGARLNELLDRIEQTLARERRFTANVAHELRTPIAELRAMAEVALRQPDAGDGSRHNYRDALDVALQMQSIVTALLALARCQPGRQTVVTESVDLAGVVGQCWQQTVARNGRGLRTRLEVPPGIVVHTDRALLGAVVTNLLCNAYEYTPSGGSITCRTERNATPGVALAISNTAHDLDARDLPKLCEPFWRKDAARSDAAHCGLGLALVESLAKLLRVDLSMELAADQSFLVRLSFPAYACGVTPLTTRGISLDTAPAAHA